MTSNLEWYSDLLKGKLTEQKDEVLIPLECGHFHGRPLKIHDASFEVCVTCAKVYRAKVSDHDDQC